MTNDSSRKANERGALYSGRQARLMEALQNQGLSAAVINPGSTLTYLTGLHFHLMERPVVAFLSAGGPLILVMPELESAKTAGLPYPIETYTYPEDPAVWGEVFTEAAQAAGLGEQPVGVEPTRMRFLELNYLQLAAPQARFVSAESALAELRMRKDASEIAAMRQAVHIAQNALLAAKPAIRVGATEREIASELVLQLLRAGSSGAFPFEPIVSGGPNSANPHAVPSDRPLQEGDLLVIDWGAASSDYVSDLTRTFAMGEVDPEYRRIFDITLEANQAGRDAIRPGIPAEVVDQAARQVIEAAGYGQYFVHRTGHGLGMEGHEAPYIRQGSTVMLEPGMTFTVEPGIYLPGRNGVRIEDDVVVTESGGESLSDLPRGWEVIG
jgi:Xaa-Pro dipeptidase